MIAQILLKIFTGIYLFVYGIVWGIIKQIIPYTYRCKSVKNELVLITGSGSGIGKLMAKKFALLGAKVICVDVNQTANSKTCAEIKNEGGEAVAYKCDLTSKDEIYSFADDVIKNLGYPSILVNNAGIVTGKKFLESPDEMIEKTFQVNTFSHFWLAKKFLPDMIERNHGHVVTIASCAGMFGAAGLVDYCSSKFAAVGFDEALRNELLRIEKTGVKTTVVCPNIINTGMFKGFNVKGLPPLDPEYVADKVIEAVLTDQELLMLPRMTYFLWILPYKFASFLDKDVMKLCHSMDQFVGRKSD